MDSLNAPVPGAVERLASDLAPVLAPFDRQRERKSLVCKRFEAYVDRADVREALAGAPAVEARVTGVDYFARPLRGPGPVVYLAVESPGLRRIHDRLVDRFGAIPGLEGDEYVPHVTLARGGDEAAAERAAARDVDPVTWTISRLDAWDVEYGERVGSISLPVPGGEG
ncbi:MAG: 2'-5' RNA ligase family protein [Haloferacaceae archaeon]